MTEWGARLEAQSVGKMLEMAATGCDDEDDESHSRLRPAQPAVTRPPMLLTLLGRNHTLGRPIH